MRDEFFVPAEPGARIIDVHGRSLPVIGWRVCAEDYLVNPVTIDGAMFGTPTRPLAVEWPDGTLTDLRDHRRYNDFTSWIEEDPLPAPVVRPAV